MRLTRQSVRIGLKNWVYRKKNGTSFRFKYISEGTVSGESQQRQLLYSLALRIAAPLIPYVLHLSFNALVVQHREQSKKLFASRLCAESLYRFLGL